MDFQARRAIEQHGQRTAKGGRWIPYLQQYDSRADRRNCGLASTQPRKKLDVVLGLVDHYTRFAHRDVRKRPPLNLNIMNVCTGSIYVFED